MPNTTTRRRFALAAPQQLISVGINSAVTSVQVTSFAGWPTQFPFYASFDLGLSGLEVVSVTNIVGTTATIVRAQRGTAAIAHPLGATMDMTAVDQDYDEANAHSSATAGLHGVAGNVVGDTDVQTITNKTLDKAKFTGDAGTEAIQSKATAAGGKVFSGRNSATTETSSINDAGNIIAKGTLTQGSTGQLTSDASGNLATSGTIAATGAATAASFTANANGQVGGVIVPKSYANEAAAGTATAGLVVYLTAPTTTGYSPGLFLGNGTIWTPVASGDSGWIVPTLGNSWVSFDGGVTFAVPAYRLLAGVVYMQGLMKSGTTSTTIFTLPAGYRPLKTLQIVVTANGGAAQIAISPAGVVLVNNYIAPGSNTAVSLDGVIFVAEQ